MEMGGVTAGDKHGETSGKVCGVRSGPREAKRRTG